jgi:hypothetical protein
VLQNDVKTKRETAELLIALIPIRFAPPSLVYIMCNIGSQVKKYEPVQAGIYRNTASMFQLYPMFSCRIRWSESST